MIYGIISAPSYDVNLWHLLLIPLKFDVVGCKVFGVNNMIRLQLKTSILISPIRICQSTFTKFMTNHFIQFVSFKE